MKRTELKGAVVKQLIFLEFNEINFEFIEAYIAQGYLPNFRRLIEAHGYCRTTSEQAYEELEPWIQWVSAHTGLTYKEHRAFRLGDAVGKGLDQVWSVLERQGVRVGALSPMNAENTLSQPAFFVPDPWTKTETSGTHLLKRFTAAVSQAVNDNASGRLTIRSLWDLLCGAVAYAQPSSYLAYFKILANLPSNGWRKAIFLDRLLADTFITLCQKTRPQFATLFLNAAAHIQHHYLFNSKVYSGNGKNPDWYIKQGTDPVLEIYQLYDQVINDVQRKLKGCRLMLATGLRQIPYERETYYWRLKNHADFLRLANIDFRAVLPRMSRDFLVECESAESAAAGANALSTATIDDQPAFSVDNRSNSLFVTLEYPFEIKANSVCRVRNVEIKEFLSLVAFVAIKNGRHDSTGYFIDSAAHYADQVIPLTDLKNRVLTCFV
ncbi:MAG: hypothetical protein AABM64_08190 [Pseudomonadota bacterium]